MKFRLLIAFFVIQSSLVFSQTPTAYTKSTNSSRRAIRQNIPLTKSIQNAFKARTRDFSGRPGPNYWQLETDYKINASLDPETQTITGQETIALHNNSNDQLKEIVLRLDHNIFRPKVPRDFSVPAETTEGMVITRLRVNGVEVDIKTKYPRFRTIPAGKTVATGLTQTVARVRLSTPIKAKSIAKVEIVWHTKLPGGNGGRGHRMTQRWGKRLFQPTQWFPRIAKYDDLRGWDRSIYLGPSEFYNNFGKFDVKIEMPAGWIVSGTGILKNADEVLTATARERLKAVLKTDATTTIVSKNEKGHGKATAKGEKLVWHYVADKVNDFAWATSNEFVWKASRANIPKKGFVPIHMFFLPERANRFRNAIRNTRHALEFYSELLGPYPFPQLTLQDGPSAGMEYPMVINSNQGAADHETFHQWIPMTLGTNETRYAWMDEGFNNYSNILSGADRRGKKYSLDGRGQRYGSISGNEWEAPMMWNANYAGTGYGYQAYGKATPMFAMLGGMVGDEVLHAAIKKYVAAWKFKHPSPWDFAFFMNNELKRDLGWFWYYWLWTTETADGSIKKVTRKGKNTLVTIHQAGEMPSPIVLKVEFAADGPKIRSLSSAKMIDKNTAIVRYPVDVWFNGNRTFEAKMKFGKRLIDKITLDPAGRFPDRNPKDNVWKRVVAARP